MQQRKLVFAPIGTVDLGPVPGSGSGARYLSLNGVQHISKCKSHSNGIWVCFNEFFAARAASRLGLPVPPFQLVAFRGDLASTETWFCSKRVEPGSNPDAVSFSQLRNSDVLGGIVVFDLWLCNTDRKNANLCVEKFSDNTEKLFLVDHGHTLLTSGSVVALRSAEFGDGRRVLALCPDLVSSVKNVNEFGRGLQALQSITDQEIGQWIEDSPAEWIPDNAVLGGLKDFLLERRDNMKPILEGSLGLFPNLRRGDV